ncbi:MAG: hypothetical protein WBC44_16170 [Planctomycetaceae bacterium]
MNTRSLLPPGRLRTAGLTAALLPWFALLGCDAREDSSVPRTAHEADENAAEAEAHHHGAHEKHGGHEHGGGEAELLVAAEPATIEPEQSVELRLTLRDDAGKPIEQFDVTHEKKLHLIIVRDGLDRFAHIHPTLEPDGSFTTTFAFPTAGIYRLYADFKPAGRKPATAIAEVEVAGTPPERPELVPNVPGRVTTDELAAEIALEPAEGATRITFQLFDDAGKPVTDLQPYLGAMGHLVVLSADGEQYVHAHPVEGTPADGTVTFDAHFPQPGLYKGWGQFQRSGIVHDVPFAVRIEDGPAVVEGAHRSRANSLLTASWSNAAGSKSSPTHSSRSSRSG